MVLTYKRIQTFPEGTAIIDVNSVTAIYPSGLEGYSIVNIGADTKLVVKGVPDQVATDFGFEVEEVQRA